MPTSLGSQTRSWHNLSGETYMASTHQVEFSSYTPSDFTHPRLALLPALPSVLEKAGFPYAVRASASSIRVSDSSSLNAHDGSNEASSTSPTVVQSEFRPSRTSNYTSIIREHWKIMGAFRNSRRPRS